MKRCYNVFRFSGYIFGLVGMLLAVPFKHVAPWAERAGLILLGLMFCSFLFSYALLVLIKMQRR